MAFPRADANAVLRELEIESPDDLLRLEDIVWARGALVRDARLTGAEARLTVLGRQAVITVSTEIDYRQRRRFAIAHELGHLEMHKRDSALTLCTSEDIERPRWGSERDSARIREAEANEFASHLLIPDGFATPLTKGRPPTLGVVNELRDTFDVSLTAAALAYMRICNEACAVVFSRDNRIQWFTRSRDLEQLGLWIAPGPLDDYTLAADFFRGRPIQPIPGRVDATSWFAPGRYRQDAMIKEHSVAMPRYGAVLTLLWVDEPV